jgi:hypothetical protein
VGVGLALSSPGVQDTRETREVGAEETLGCGEALEGERRGFDHGVVREALRRAEEGAARLRDGEGEEAVRPGTLCVQGVLEPRLGFMLRTLGTVSVATGRIAAVVLATAWARREAVAIVPALARVDGADDLAV